MPHVFFFASSFGFFLNTCRSLCCDLNMLFFYCSWTSLASFRDLKIVCWFPPHQRPLLFSTALAFFFCTTQSTACFWFSFFLRRFFLFSLHFWFCLQNAFVLFVVVYTYTGTAVRVYVFVLVCFRFCACCICLRTSNKRLVYVFDYVTLTTALCLLACVRASVCVLRPLLRRSTRVVLYDAADVRGWGEGGARGWRGG